MYHIFDFRYAGRHVTGLLFLRGVPFVQVYREISFLFVDSRQSVLRCLYHVATNYVENQLPCDCSRDKLLRCTPPRKVSAFCHVTTFLSCCLRTVPTALSTGSFRFSCLSLATSQAFWAFKIIRIWNLKTPQLSTPLSSVITENSVSVAFWSYLYAIARVGYNLGFSSEFSAPTKSSHKVIGPLTICIHMQMKISFVAV